MRLQLKKRQPVTMSTGQNKEGVDNILWNIVEPLSTQKQFQGSAQYVIKETLVSQVVRMVMGLGRNWAKSAEIHAISVPLIGVTNPGPNFVGPQSTADPSTAIAEGLQASPGAALAYIVQHIRVNGLGLPHFFNKEFLSLIVGKVASRVIWEYLSSSLPDNISDANDVLIKLMNRQSQVAESKRRRR